MTEGYRLSKPIGKTVSHLLYVDNFSKDLCCIKREAKEVMDRVRVVMRDIGLQRSESKCLVVHVKRGILNAELASARINKNNSIKNLSDGSNYKFLEAMEITKLNDKLSLEIASKAYNMVWTSLLSDYNKVLAST